MDNTALPSGVFLLPPNTTSHPTFTVDVSGMTEIGAILERIGTVLQFPDWYGANFDALMDCLSDPDWQPGSSPVILVEGLRALGESKAAQLETLLDVLRAASDSRSEEGLGLSILIDYPATGVANWPEIAKPAKQPVSVLVVIYTRNMDVLLLERAAHPDLWQSVTGSREGTESLAETAHREVLEETGIDSSQYTLTDWHIENDYEIFPAWRHRYPAGVTRNNEHVFGLQLPDRVDITIAPDEHRACCWLPWQEAAERCFSWSNRDAIRLLPAVAKAD
ncbi:dihydroneopterin triphosphate diphosphatase [Azonexus sp.]|uniref:dihydroneopterin triphosphate diphosphatase n=1 Tax=Azonexus sp. TaxID=1872668 RepID=UPI0027BA7FC1|nr:dihydroneopterin triphosphate diphosphatase [Azonexus sp.]